MAEALNVGKSTNFNQFLIIYTLTWKRWQIGFTWIIWIIWIVLNLFKIV